MSPGKMTVSLPFPAVDPAIENPVHMEDKERLTGLDKLYIEFRASLLTRVHGATMIPNDPAPVFPNALGFSHVIFSRQASKRADLSTSQPPPAYPGGRSKCV